MLASVIARSLLPFSLALLLPAVAAADEKNPAAEACAGKAEGAPCSSERIVQVDGRAEKRNEPGSCQPDQCCALDYASGPPPKSTCGPCLVCKPGAPGPATTGDTANATGAEPPRAEGGGDPPAVAPNEKRGCAVAGTTKAEQPPSWWLLGLVVIGWPRRSSANRPRYPTSRPRRCTMPSGSPWSRR